jgi:hypothetical protein
VVAPTLRLERRIRSDFGGDADEVLALLTTIPESLPLGERQSAERIQAAVVVGAQSNLTQVRTWLDIARTDWRDALMSAGLAHPDWPHRLDEEFGRPG